MKQTVRAFIAVEISTDVRRLVKKTLAPLKRDFPEVKWIDDENFHVTLKFLGPNVPIVEIHKVIAAIKRACRNVEQFDLVFEGLGAFPNVANPRTIWVGVTDGVDELRELVSEIDKELEKLGYPSQGRSFSPHLTIGRARLSDRYTEDRQSERSLADQIKSFDDSFWGCCPVDRVVLYSSELERNGAKYEPLATIDLATDAFFDDEDASEDDVASPKKGLSVPKIPELTPDRDKLRFTPRPPKTAKPDSKTGRKKGSPNARKKSSDDDVFNLSQQDIEQFDSLLRDEDEN